MKILLVTTHLNAGGITTYSLSLGKGLQEKGCEVLLASGGGDFEKVSGLEHHNVGIKTKCEIGPKVILGAIKIRQMIHKKRIDLIHAQTRVAAMTSFLAAFGTRVPLVTTAHGFFRPHWGRRIVPCWGRAVIAISSQVSEHLKVDFRVNPNRIHLIHNGIDLKPFDKPLAGSQRTEMFKRIGLDPSRPLIGIVARLSPVKGHKYLLEALHLLKSERSIQCLVVGDGPSQKEFLDDLKRLNLGDCVRWIPWVDDPLNMMRLFDIFVLPSLQEGLSLSILEAQASGIPVVASNVGGISEVVVDGKTGILVPPRDSAVLKKAIGVLLDNISLAREMGRYGREHVHKHFGLDRMVNQVMETYQQVLRGV